MKIQICAFVLMAACVVAHAEGSASRTWTSASGAKVTAELISQSGGYVSLKKADGATVKVRLSQLSAEDQKYVADQAALAGGGGKGPTGGTVTVAFTTTTSKGQYAPKNFVAVWVADAQGRMVKPLEVVGSERSQVFLKDWMRAKKKAKSIDAVSTATLTAHKAHSIKWDCKSSTGAVVPDGEYRIMIEVAEGPSKGVTTPDDYLRFVKGPDSVSLAPEDLKHITGISVKYAPTGGSN